MKKILLLLVLCFTGCSSLQKQQSLKLDVTRNWARQSTNKEYVGPKLLNSSAPVVDGDVIYQGNAHDGVMALSRKSGNQMWRMTVENGVTSGLAVSKDKLYFAGNDGQFYALKKSNGSVVWTYPTQSEVFSKPLIEGTRIFFAASNGNLTALDAETGKIAWTYFQRDNANMNIRSGSSPTIEGDYLYIGFGDGTVASINKNTGYLKWDRNLSTPKEKFRDADSRPLINGDTLFISTYEGGLYALKKLTGEILWKTDRGSSSNAISIGNKLYYASTDGFVVSVDKGTGKEEWTYKVKSGVATPITYFKELLIFGTSDGPLEFLSLKGEKLSEYSTGWGISAPIVSNESKSEIYVFSNYGNLYSLSLNWKRPIQDWPWEHL